uniref:Uncharacterized protein n=1 Tax=Anopheles dirus TaxID=7168 RepID=A0A182NXZ6_9DIPT
MLELLDCAGKFSGLSAGREQQDNNNKQAKYRRSVQRHTNHNNRTSPTPGGFSRAAATPAARARFGRIACAVELYKIVIKLRDERTEAGKCYCCRWEGKKTQNPAPQTIHR